MSGTVAELEALSGMGKQLLPSGIEKFVTEHAPLIQQACVVTSPEGDVVVVVVQRGLEWGAGVGKKRERERGQRR